MNPSAFLEIASGFGLHLHEWTAPAMVRIVHDRWAAEHRAVSCARGCHPTTRAASLFAPYFVPSVPVTSDVPSAEDATQGRGTSLEARALRAVRPAVAIKQRKGGGCVVVKSRMKYKGDFRRDRKPIERFTDASRLALLKRINSFDESIVRGELGVFVTLTYGKVYPSRFKRWKAQLKAFRAALERLYGHLGVVWKLEPQRRGAPHFHLLVFFRQKPDVAGLREFVRRAWSRIVDPCRVPMKPGEKRARIDPEGVGRARRLSGVKWLRTEVTPIRHFGGVISYAVKYIEKDSSRDGVLCNRRGEPIAPGRFWAIWRPELLQSAELGECGDEVAMVRARRMLRKYVEKREAKLRRRSSWAGAGVPSLTAFVPERIASRIFDHCMPWRRLGLTFDQWRAMEMQYRRRLYIERIKEELDYPPEFPAWDSGGCLESS